MGLSRKYYSLIAGVVRNTRDMSLKRWQYNSSESKAIQETYADLAANMALVLKEDNYNFSRDRFLEACECTLDFLEGQTDEID